MSHAQELLEWVRAYDPVADIEGDPDNAAVTSALLAIREARRVLSQAEEVIEASLAETIPGGGEQIDGVGFVEVKSVAEKETWLWDELLPVLIARARDARDIDPETGEVADPVEHAINWLARIVGLTASKKGRKTELRKVLGSQYDLDEFVRTTWTDRKSIKITGATKDAAA